jgi:hypothetical protein
MDHCGGKLYRSAPENTRLALPEEGQPAGPELPDDLTQIQQQINRITINQPMQSIPGEEIVIPNNEIIPNNIPGESPVTHQPRKVRPLPNQITNPKQTAVKCQPRKTPKKFFSHMS